MEQEKSQYTKYKKIYNDILMKEKEKNNDNLNINNVNKDIILRKLEETLKHIKTKDKEQDNRLKNDDNDLIKNKYLENVKDNYKNYIDYKKNIKDKQINHMLGLINYIDNSIKNEKVNSTYLEDLKYNKNKLLDEINQIRNK